MRKVNTILILALGLVFLVTMPGCAKVGSERWCKKMAEKSAADWTAREAKDYAKHCVFE